eukprot:jgi/Bigna1/131281/aug1.13_g5989
MSLLQLILQISTSLFIVLKTASTEESVVWGWMKRCSSNMLRTHGKEGVFRKTSVDISSSSSLSLGNIMTYTSKSSTLSDITNTNGRESSSHRHRHHHPHFGSEKYFEDLVVYYDNGNAAKPSLINVGMTLKIAHREWQHVIMGTMNKLRDLLSFRGKSQGCHSYRQDDEYRYYYHHQHHHQSKFYHHLNYSKKKRKKKKKGWGCGKGKVRKGGKLPSIDTKSIFNKPSKRSLRKGKIDLVIIVICTPQTSRVLEDL